MIKERIIIRKAVESDFGAVNHLFFEVYNLYHQNIPEAYKKIPKKILLKGDFLNMLEGDSSTISVAILKDQIIGLVYMYTEKETRTHISPARNRVCIAELCVLKNYRRQGTGSLLIQNAEQWAKNHKINNLVVLVYAFNQDAINFYQKLGYSPYSIQLNKTIK